MKTRVISAIGGVLVITAAVLLLRTTKETTATDEPGKTTTDTSGRHPDGGRPIASAPETPASPVDLAKARRDYKETLRQRLFKDGLAASLKDTVEKPMSDTMRQDLFIEFITGSLETDGLEKTVDEILAGLEPGTQRDMCIELAFVNAKDDLPVLHRRLMALESEEERKSAMEGIQSAIGNRDVSLRELLATFPEPFPREVLLAGSAHATASPFNPTTDRKQFIDRNVSDLVDAIRNGDVEKGAIGRFVRDASLHARGESSFHLWDSINSVERMEGLSIHPTTYKKLAGSMMSMDAARTFSSLAASRITLSPDVISESAKSWLNHQNTKPVEWLQANGKDLDPAFKDAFITGLVDYNLERGGVAESRQWSDQIQDPELKQRIRQRIDGAAKR